MELSSICFDENNIRIIGSYQDLVCGKRYMSNFRYRSALRIIPDKWKDERILPSLDGKQITNKDV